MKTLLTVVSLSLVSIAGLVSCTETSPDAPGVVHVADSWKLPTPQMHSNHEGRKLVLDVVGERIMEPIGADATLVFPADQLAALQGVKITAHANCSLDSKRYDGNAVFESASEIHLSELMPANAFVRSDIESLRNLVCEFDFAAVGPNGTSHAFNILQVHFDDFSSFENLAVTSVATKDFSGALSLLRSENFASTFLSERQPALGTISSVSVLCGQFRNLRVEIGSLDNAAILNELLGGEIKSLSGEKVDRDSRGAWPRQTCRLFRTSKDQDGREDFAYSKPFAVRFPIAAPIVHMSNGADDYNSKSSKNISFMNVRIENPNDTDQEFALTSLEGADTVQIDAVALNAGALVSTRLPNGRIVTNIPTEADAGTKNGERRVLVRGHQAVTIEFHLVMNSACANIDEARGGPYQFAGFQYALVKPIQLKQFTNWVENHDESEVRNLTLWETPVDGKDLGWLPHPAWVQRMGPALTSVPVPGTALCREHTDDTSANN